MRRCALYDYGFRPFFLFAAIWAVIAMAVWLRAQNTDLPFLLLTGYDWHIHELLFGFTAAAIGGFLLTSVPNWTGQRGYGGRPVILLSSLWLAARISLFPGFDVPPHIGAVLDLVFYPAIAFTVLPALVRSGNVRNYPVVYILTALTIANGICWSGYFGLWPEAIGIGPRLGLGLVLLFVTFIGGRIVPSFTMSTLRNEGVNLTIQPIVPLERLVAASSIACIVIHAFLPTGLVTGGIAAIAAAAQATRFARWQGHRTVRFPILFILHIAYFFLVFGLTMLAVHALTGANFSAAYIHALTVGAFVMMSVAVMSRAALGHTGRPIVAAPMTSAAYALLTLAAIVRFTGPALGFHREAVMLSGILWCFAFLALLFVYAPILVSPRIDGRPG